MSLREKYNYAIQMAKSFTMLGSAAERDGKLYFKGTVQSQDQANQIWDAIKTVPTWQKEIVAEIRAIDAPEPQPASTGTSESGTSIPQHAHK